MSNYSIIAAVTATLRDQLQGAVSQAVSGAHVAVSRPDRAGEGAFKGPLVNIYLYQVTPNIARRNEDLPSRDNQGHLRARPCLALDLHYLLSFYGDELAFEPQRLLGSTVASLHARPVIGRDLIRATLGTAGQEQLAGGNSLDETVLSGTDLSEQFEPVRLTPTSLSLEELSKFWSILQVPYVLSVSYQASTVLLEAAEVPLPALPVRKVQITRGLRPEPLPSEGPEVTIQIPKTARNARGLKVTIDPPVRREQHTLLLLNELDGERAYQLSAPPDNGISGRAVETSEITFALPVEPGKYLVRLKVDQAESRLEWDENSGYTGPIVNIKA